MQANCVQLYFYQLNSMKKRGGSHLFGDKTTTILSPGRGVGQPQGTQPGVVETSARALPRTQSRVAGATEVMAGSLLRDPACPGSRPEGLSVPSTCRGPKALLISYSAFPCGEGDQKTSSQPSYATADLGPGNLLLQQRSVGCSGCYTTCCHGLSRDRHWVTFLPGTAVLALRSICTSPRKLPAFIATSYLQAKNLGFGKPQGMSQRFSDIFAHPATLCRTFFLLPPPVRMQCHMLRDFRQIGFMANCLHLHALKPAKNPAFILAGFKEVAECVCDLT